MKKIIIASSIIIAVFTLLFLSKSEPTIESKYDNLETAFLDYANMLFDKNEISIDSVKNDLAGFEYIKSKEIDYLEFKYSNTSLNQYFIENSLHRLTLEKNTENRNKSIDTDGVHTIDTFITSNNLESQSETVGYIDDSLEIDIIKNNKKTINSYLGLLEVLKKEGNINIDTCRKLLNLELDTVDEVLDMTSTLKHGYFNVYYEKQFTIKTFKDIVVDVSLKLDECKSDVNYCIILGTSNDFIDSEENRIKIFIAKENMDAILKSSYTNTTLIFLNPNYNVSNELSKDDFNKVYKLFTSVN